MIDSAGGGMTMDVPADAPTDDGDIKRPEMPWQEALALLIAGKEVVGVKIRRIVFSGEITYAVNFRNCVLIQPEFRKCVFKEGVHLLSCTVDRLQFVRKNTFEKEFKLDGSTVSKLMMKNAEVNGNFSARNALFRGKFFCQDCDFKAKSNFWEARFETWTNFLGCRFGDEADFRSIHADQGFVISNNSVMEGDFLFRGANVEKKFQLDGARFMGAVDLSKAKLHDFAYMEAIEQGPKQTFSFLNTVGERIRVRPEQIEGRLASELAGKHEDAMQEYGLLKKCYSALHRFDQEDWAFYRFKVAQRKSKPMSWKRPWTVWRTAGDYLFLDVGCGYGTNPLRAVRMAVVIILFFALIYAVNVEMFYADPNKLPFPGPGSEKTDLDNRVMIGFITSVSVFTSGMGGIREIAKGWMNVPVMIESIMGTLLFGLFIVAFSRKVIR